MRVCRPRQRLPTSQFDEFSVCRVNLLRVHLFLWNVGKDCIYPWKGTWGWTGLSLNRHSPLGTLLTSPRLSFPISQTKTKPEWGPGLYDFYASLLFVANNSLWDAAALKQEAEKAWKAVKFLITLSTLCSVGVCKCQYIYHRERAFFSY